MTMHFFWFFIDDCFLCNEMVKPINGKQIFSTPNSLCCSQRPKSTCPYNHPFDPKANKVPRHRTIRMNFSPFRLRLFQKNSILIFSSRPPSQSHWNIEEDQIILGCGALMDWWVLREGKREVEVEGICNCYDSRFKEKEIPNWRKHVVNEWKMPLSLMEIRN